MDCLAAQSSIQNTCDAGYKGKKDPSCSYITVLRQKGILKLNEFFPFTDEETETQRGGETCVRFNSMLEKPDHCHFQSVSVTSNTYVYINKRKEKNEQKLTEPACPAVIKRERKSNFS